MDDERKNDERTNQNGGSNNGSNQNDWKAKDSRYVQKRMGIFPGVILIVIGILVLLKNLGINIPFIYFLRSGNIIATFWAAIFLMLPGLLFHIKFFSGGRQNPGVLVPGGILLVIGLTCQLSTLFNIWGVLWPGFIFAVAVGLFELYLFGKREKELLIPVFILGGLSLVFFFSFSIDMILEPELRKYIFPVALLLIGLLVVFRSIKRTSSK